MIDLAIFYKLLAIPGVTGSSPATRNLVRSLSHCSCEGYFINRMRVNHNIALRIEGASVARV